MSNTVHLIRRSSSVSRERALQTGFGEPNVQRSTRMLGTTEPPGVFFAPFDEGNKSRFEQQAKEYAARVTREAMIVQLGITDQTFPHLQKRLFSIITDATNPFGEMQYVPIPDVATLRRKSPVVINFRGLAHEDLLNLDLTAGFLTSEGNYDYRTYEAWTQDLGVRAKTREELDIEREGFGQGFRK